MENIKNDLLQLTPMESYNTPDLPTLAKGTPDLSKKVPSRWKSKVMVAAVAGLLGTTALAGCDDYQMHYGGAAMAPLYVAYLTEQEALGIVRSQLEEAGLNFVDLPIEWSLTVSFDRGDEQVGVDLFDEDNRLAIMLINLGEQVGWRELWYDRVHRSLEEGFSSEYFDTVYVLFSDTEQWEDWDEEENESQRIEAHGRIEESLLKDIQELIHQLREDGVID